ncbi:hypothetical protein K9M74_01325 [Candidatus Woesearchaeota archaeon]|nr:hypothetical protein [Candidatus Woesearchaeota archaeon]
MMDEDYLHIVGDTHNVESLQRILLKYDNILSLGDIGAATDHTIFEGNNMSNYRLAWRHFSKGDVVSPEIVAWFKQLNISSWIAQINNIVASGKLISIIQGNSDLAMLEFFPECKTFLDEQMNEKFHFIRELEIIEKNHVVLVLIPFSRKPYNLQFLAEVNKEKKIIVFSHCPPMKLAKKPYYTFIYDVLDVLAKQAKQEVLFFHGHMHPDQSYVYKPNGIVNLTCICPKAEENRDGIGVNHHVVKLNLTKGIFKIFDSITNKEIKLVNLPDEFFTNEDHWNTFDETELAK